MPDPLRELPRDYWDSGDIRQFMERASTWIMHFCRQRLNHDPDVIGDFYVYFYERADLCLETYKTRQDLPFTGFLATYLRHEFYNFIYPRRRYSVDECMTADILGLKMASEISYPITVTERQILLEKMMHELASMPVAYRLPLKLTHGMELNCEEMRTMIAHCGSPRKAAHFLQEYNRKRERRREKLMRLRNRVAHLNYMIHASPRRKGISTDAFLWRKWKRRILTVIERQSAICSRSDIARLLRMNKSTVARRIDRAESKLRRGAVWKTGTER